ncbi:MAG: enoyl-CoA hydratase [Candidatus Nephthysia bennettiae]|uniref:Enoyl-CoA hydratase domain-containing protein 3, mitochondrial n=1 Tax=Candidatus Nephthysia bennettiae TaxID=3127016 RepID=A0A934KCZ5_9BACT|nr:enoyl-CoA hydratase [Candidatus Dormibacteraeota bacterium]MBJ7613743.1 enoyl-CoA hydratase [Candidatus Dormibacteraeota bacterium]PZR92574.1 MAG: enoyl-CoA hydratase [Candidatus Dormibacteraeota bacterium]
MAVAQRHLLVEDALPAVVITLNRPEQRNALSTPLMLELTQALERESARPEVRAIVLRASGPAFSAGHDLKELLDRSLDEEREIFDVCTRMMQTVQRVPQPVIAAVQGIATAAGCQLVATCDLAIASETARFATPGVKIGLFCSTPMVALSRNIGRKRALEMLLSGRPIDAATAADWGLVNRVVPAAELDQAALELALQVASASPLTLRIGKQAFYRQIDVGQDEAYDLMSQTMAENAMTGDAQEGMSAFLDKRQPTWRGE